MLDRLVLAAVASASLVGAVVQSCAGPVPALLDQDGGEAQSAVATCAPVSSGDVAAVLDLLVEARRLLYGTPEGRFVPSEVVPGRVCHDSLILQFSGGPLSDKVGTVFLADPDEAVGNPPVWYDPDMGRISYCSACMREESFSPGMLGVLYARALFDQATLPSVTDEESALRQEMEGALLMLSAANRAAHGNLIRDLNKVLTDRTLSEPLTPESPWKIPSYDGWDLIEETWPWPSQSLAEGEIADDIVHLSCALLQGRSPKQHVQAFLAILDYTAQGC